MSTEDNFKLEMSQEAAATWIVRMAQSGATANATDSILDILQQAYEVGYAKGQQLEEEHREKWKKEVQWAAEKQVKIVEALNLEYRRLLGWAASKKSER